MTKSQKRYDPEQESDAEQYEYEKESNRWARPSGRPDVEPANLCRRLKSVASQANKLARSPERKYATLFLQMLDRDETGALRRTRKKKDFPLPEPIACALDKSISFAVTGRLSRERREKLEGAIGAIVQAHIDGGGDLRRAKEAALDFASWAEKAERKVRENVESAKALAARDSLLAAIHALFVERNLDRLATAEVLSRLNSMDKCQWSSCGPMTARRLASELSDFGIRAKRIRVGSALTWGYVRIEFEDEAKRARKEGIARLKRGRDERAAELAASGMSQRAIAAKLGIGVSTVNRILSRARSS